MFLDRFTSRVTDADRSPLADGLSRRKLLQVGAAASGGLLLSLHLPGEAFVEYQLAAQKMRPDAAVHVAAYGDDGPGYIPIARAYLDSRVQAIYGGTNEIMKEIIGRTLGL